VTHRTLASSVHIITGHKRAGEPLNLPFEAYANAEGTLVFLMGVSALGDIARGLLDAGMRGDTPAALLEQGTTVGQRRVIATLETLEAEAEKQAIGTPAIIVVGAVAALSDELCWYEQLPLFGRRFVLTRPSERMDALARELRKRGAQVLELPAITLRAMEADDGIRTALRGLLEHSWDCLAFTSPAGVQTFFELLFAQGLDGRCLGGCRFATIGSGTAQALRTYGLLSDFMPEAYNGVALGTLLAEQLGDGSRVLIPRSNIGNPKLITSMEQRGQALGKRFLIQDLAIYETLESPIPEELPPLSSVDGIFFTSASTVRGFLNMYAGDVTGLTALCMGEMTAEAARAAGMQVRIAEKSSIEGLILLAERMKGQ
jgi:uroporphyrinogen III methyltransferase/synthase